MARIKKFSPKENLTSFNTFVVDTGDNSDYFRITEFKDTFTGGKNGFLIEGSPYLKESTEIKMEILDVNGDPIYYEPGNGIPEYYEGISKLIAVYVYNDTPIGTAKITILGELKEYVDETGIVRQIPQEWQGVYNVKWEKEFKVNKLLSNEDRVRFYRRPQIQIDEIVKPIFSGTPPTRIQTGSADGLALVPVENSNLSDFTLPTSYRLKVSSGNGWTGSMENQTITFDGLNYSPRINEVVNETELIVSPPYTENNIVKSFSGEDYSVNFTYLEGFNDLKTALTGSFAKISITDMKTFVGDAARVKVFRRSQSQLTDYEFVQEIQLESNELLRDIETLEKTQENYGLFTGDVLNNYWNTSVPTLTATINQDFLYNSVQLSGSAGEYFFTTQSFNIQEGVEYTLDFNVRLSGSVNPNDSVRFFLSGSYNGSSKTQDITTVNSSTFVLQKTNFSENIVADNFDSAKLYVEPIGSSWYINNVSLKASQETSFSPDEITFIQQVPKTLSVETFDYRFEFYDINNNFIPVRVEDSKTFVGGNTNLFNKSIEITPDNLYFSFDSASNPANPIPPTVINFDVQTTLVTGSITYTSGAYDFSGNLIPSSSYIGGQYPGLLSDLDVRGGTQPFLTVQNFTGSRDDIIVQFIRYTGEVEGVSDSTIITRVEDGKGGVSFEIVPYRGTVIKNKEDKSLEVQAVRVDGINRIDLKSGLQRNFSDAKLHLASSSLDAGNEVTTYVSLSQAITNPDFITGIFAGTTGSGELDYNARFTRDAIDNELVVYLMDGPTTESILTSLILTDLKDGLGNGVVRSTTDQFNIKYKPRQVSLFDPQRSIVTASFYRRGTTLNPISASLEVIPSSSIEPKTELPQFFMFYETGAFDDTVTIAVTDFRGNSIDSGVPGITAGVPYYTAEQTKQLNLEFTYTEPITSASVTANKSFFITPDGLPGQDSINIEIDPFPVALSSNAKGNVYNYSLANTEINLLQGDIPLIHTASGDPGTFTTRSINVNGIEYGTFAGESTTTMSLAGFESMSALSASVVYNFNIYPYFTASLITASKVQKFTKVVEGAGAIEISLEPSVVNFNADENGYVSDYGPSKTEIVVKQDDDYLLYDPTNSGTPGTYVTSSVTQTNILLGNYSSSNRISGLSGDEILHFNNISDMSAVSASINYNFIVYPYAIKGGVAGVPTNLSKKQVFTRTNEGRKARKVTLTSTAYSIVYDGDGQRIAPEGNVRLTATATNITSSNAYYEFIDITNNTNVNILGPSTVSTLNLGSEDLPNTGSEKTIKVELRDGSATSNVEDSDTISISGIQEGSTAYTAILSNPASSITVEVDGTTYFDNAGTLIRAYKGGTELQYVEEYNEAALDPVTFLPLGTFGQFSASVHEISPFLTQGTLRDGKEIVSSSGELYASASAVTNWNLPQDNTQGYIIYKIDFENGRGTQFVQQSFSTVFEGATGPGLVVRGEWDETIPYVFDLNQKRRDAVFKEIGGNVHYWATTELTPTASEYVNGDGVYTLEPQYDAGPPPTQEGDIDYTTTWQYLGQQDFFVAAKLAIFEESFVKNTINVGIPPAGNPNAQIAIVGGTDEPYISVGQTGTQGFRQPGVFIGMTNDFGSSGTAGTTGILSLKSSPIGTPPNQTYNSMEWDGNTLTIRGAIRQTAAGEIEGSLRGAWTGSEIYYPNDIVSNEGQSWTMIGLSHTASVDTYEPGVGVDYPESWSLAASAGSSGTSGDTAKTIRLSASSQTFRVAKDGSITPSSITLTANRQNISTATTFASSPSVTLGGSGDVRTLSDTDFGANTAVTIEASADGLSDEITIVKVEEGSDAITVVNTNQSHTVTAANDGTVTSGNLAGSGTTIKVFEGASPLTFTTSTPGVGEFSASVVQSPSSTMNTFTIGGNGTNTATVADFTTMASGTDSVVITYALTIKKDNGTIVTLNTTQTIAKSKAGESGTSGTSGASGQAAGVVYAGEWTLTLPDGSTPDATDKVAYLGEDDLKYVVKYETGGSTYWVTAVTHRYAGAWSSGQDYALNDIVSYLGTYWRANSAVTGVGTTNPPNTNASWDSLGGASNLVPGTLQIGGVDAFDSFGAEFTSVATDILFAQDVYADKTINVGAKNASAVIALNSDAGNSNANPYISIGQGGTQGYGQDGIFLGFHGGTAGVTGTPRFSMYADITDPDAGFVDFDGTNLVYSGFVTGSDLRGGTLLVGFDTNSGEWNFRVNEQGEVTALGDNNSFSGTITANNGVLGGWSINSAGIQDADGRIILNSNDSEFSVGDTDGNPRFNANTGVNLPDLSGGGTEIASVSITPITGTLGVGNTTTGNGVTATNYRVSNSMTTTSAGKYKMKAMHYLNSNAYVEAVGAGSYATISVKAELRNSSTGGAGDLSGSSQTITQQSIGYDEGGIEFESVIQGTKITLPNGESKNVEDLNVNDTILAWNIETNQYESAKIKHLKSRVVDKVYRVTVGDNVVEVSDTHGFFYAPGWKTKVTDLRPGEDEVYVKEGDSFVKRIVDSVEVIDKKITVYSMEIPKLRNYISNNIVSHNYATYIPISGGINQLPTTLLTKTIESLPAGTYYVHYVIDTDLTVTAADAQYYAEFSYAPSSTTHYVTLEAQNTGTYVNGGGFAVIKDATNYLRVASDDTKAFGSSIGYIADLRGGFAVDKMYGAGGFTAAPGVGGAWNLAGHPYAIKGGGLINISFASITTANPTETIASSFGNFDSISSTNYGRWDVTIDTVLSTGNNADGKWFGMVGSGVRLISGGGGDDQQLGLGTGTVQSNVASSTATIQVWAQDPSATSGGEDGYTNIARLNFLIIG